MPPLGRRAAWTGQLLAAVVAIGFTLLSVSSARADPLDDDTRRLAKLLQCPVCEGVSVADSPSELAGQMRGVIRRKLEQGEADQTILAYFVDRYGDGVLVEPPRRGIGLGVWVGPVVMIVVGGIVLAVTLRYWLRARPTPAPREGAANPSVTQSTMLSTPVAVGASYTERARRELDGFRERS